MPTHIDLPACLMDALKGLFPTLKWERVSFFLGIKAPFSRGSQNAITLPSGSSGINIYIREEEYQPCTQEFFVLCAHELVHALQIQESFAGGKGLGLFNPFSFKYLSCYFHEFSAKEGEGNKYEDEAYDYSRMLDGILNTIPQAQRLPCSCDSIPFLTPNPQFVGVAALAQIDNRVIKRKVKSKGACKGQVLLFGQSSGTSFREQITAAVTNAFGWGLVGMVTGIIIGAIILGPIGVFLGVYIGGFIGMAIGIIDWLTGIPSGIIALIIIIVGAIVDAIVNLVSSLIDWLSPGTRPLNVIFSQDDGQTFANKATVGATGEPPALAFSNDTLFIGFISSDNKLNLVNAPNPRHKKWGWSSDDCGPALTWGGNRLYLVWQRKKNRVVSRTSTDGQHFTGRVRIRGKVPDDATPGVAFGNGRAFVAWIRKKNNKIGIKSSADSGATWGQESTLKARSRNHGSAAVAFGNGKLYVAWATEKRQRLHIATLSVSSSGAVSMSSDLDLNVRCKKDTGPALAFGNNRLFVAWVGRGKQKLNVRTFDVSASGDLSQRYNVRLEKRAKRNAGPALAYGMNVLVLGWLRKKR